MEQDSPLLFCLENGTIMLPLVLSEITIINTGSYILQMEQHEPEQHEGPFLFCLENVTIMYCLRLQ